MDESKYIALMIVAIVAVGSFYAVLITFSLKRSLLMVAKKKFCRGLISILDNCHDDAACVPQIQMLYKRLAEKYSQMSSVLRSSPDIMEDLLCAIDTMTDKSFLAAYKIPRPIHHRARIVSSLSILKNLQPFSSVSSKQANLLNLLKQAIESSNHSLGESAISQLADEIQILEGNVRTQTKRNQASFAVSIVGVILTIFFGLLAFVNLIK